MRGRSVPDSAVRKMICAQERAMVAEVDSIRVSNKPEVIGALFEDTFRGFLRQVIPASLSIVPGFIVGRDGKQSSHFDALIVDSNFPFLSSIGPHRYVMLPAVVGAIELTTNMDNKKLLSILRKSAEIEKLSRDLYTDYTRGAIIFTAVAVDSMAHVERISGEFKKYNPRCHLYTLRPPLQATHAIHCWMEGKSEEKLVAVRYTESPLADLVSDQLQNSAYTLAERVRHPDAVGAALNGYIHYGTVAVRFRPTNGS